MNNSQPLVSICCVTYNHAPIIRKCLDGFLMQLPPLCVSQDAKMSDWCEILIHDDASTDGTDDIIREYAAKYPDVIFPLYEEENQYSRGGAGKMDLYNYKRARGKYIAYCEGDDYWTDLLKLQKQVDFLEAHSEYSVCWHRCKQLIAESGAYIEDKCSDILQGKEGVDIKIDTYFSQWYTQPLTMVFRRAKYDSSWREQYQYYRDEHELYHLLKNGKGYLFSFFGGVYVKHGGGIYSSLSKSSQGETSLKVARELFMVNRDQFTHRFYCDTLQWQIYENVGSFKLKVKYSWELFCVERKMKRFIRNLIR
ncbi:MAG: glycosyltransferase family 2 protein [Bacteroidales bacterium]|nr:glycosyltransferase family 2 protein [Bacteroidales bacterium]